MGLLSSRGEAQEHQRQQRPAQEPAVESTSRQCTNSMPRVWQNPLPEPVGAMEPVRRGVKREAAPVSEL
eukprot:4630139-Lingulodinium_polyedra.AAC.1